MTDGLGSVRRMLRETAQGEWVARLYADTPTYPPSRQVIRRQVMAEAKKFNRRDWRGVLRRRKEAAHRDAASRLGRTDLAGGE